MLKYIFAYLRWGSLSPNQKEENNKEQNEKLFHKNSLRQQQVAFNFHSYRKQASRDKNAQSIALCIFRKYFSNLHSKLRVSQCVKSIRAVWFFKVISPSPNLGSQCVNLALKTIYVASSFFVIVHRSCSRN